jgi:hypothetical protein
MDELQELKKFNKWRKEIGKTLPELASRVFALRSKGYMGCGFHWSLEKDLGHTIAAMNDFDRVYRDFTTRIAVEVRYECFIERLEEIESEVSQRAREV